MYFAFWNRSRLDFVMCELFYDFYIKFAVVISV